MAKIVIVKFDNDTDLDIGKEYSYKTSIDVKVGDLVVVEVAISKQMNNLLGFNIARVYQTEGLSKNQLETATKHIVCLVDLDEFNRVKEQEKLSQEIKNKLRQRKEEYEEVMIYNTLAKNDPEIKSLMDQLAAIDPTIKMLTK